MLELETVGEMVGGGDRGQEGGETTGLEGVEGGTGGGVGLGLKMRVGLERLTLGSLAMASSCPLGEG